MHERAISMSKGKAREGSTWQLGWWDLCHSTEGVRRPLEWTKSSIIFTAHPNQPLILARHFPSSRQFLIPSPAAIVSSPASYEPPTIISVSQTDDWLFAYFPGRGRDGVGCLWKKGAQVDSWIVKESWGFAIGAGVVTTAWTCAHREWVMSDTGTTYRLPPRGPFTPSSGPRLLLVTQSHQLHVCSLSPSLRMTRASLLQSSDTRIQIDSDTIGGPGGERVCIKAAIGLGYSESSILVAMRSQLLPSRSVNHSSFTSMEFLSLDMSNPSTPSENVFTTEWELWGEEPTIHVCEVQLDPREGIPIVTRPLSPLSPGSTHLAELSFFCQPPLRSPGSNSKGMKKDSKEASIDKGGLYLIAGFLDPGDYTSVPKSEIALFSFVKKDGPSSSNGSNWTCRLEAKRIVETKVLGFLAPSLSRNSLLAGFLDISGPLPHRKQRTKEVVIGSIEVLKLPDLSNHEGWERAPMVTSVEGMSAYVPVSVAISPNGTLVSTIPSAFLGSYPFIHTLPRPCSPISTSTTSASHHRYLSRHLVCAIHSRTSPSDIIHSLSQPIIPLDVVINTLYGAMSLLDSDSNGLSEMWMGEILGVAIEVYMARARRAENSPDKDKLTACWRIAHDIASLSACCSAFEDCQEGEVYDLDAIWQLIGMTSWFIILIEKLLKQCVMADGHPVPLPVKTIEADISFEHPIFLLLAHPYALSRVQTVLAHVRRFRRHVAGVSAKGENSQIAKDVLIDVIDGCGANLDILGPVLSDVLRDTKTLSVDDLRRSLVSCCPVPALRVHMRKEVDRVLNSKVIDRPRLFVKPGDLIDGISCISMVEHHIKEKDMDIVSKGLLLHSKSGNLCLRCGGKSEVLVEGTGEAGDASLRWRTWEKAWTRRCVCGGTWIHSSV